MKYAREHLRELLARVKRFNNIFIFIDYDGTLVGFKDNPEDAIPSKYTIKLISNLANIPEIVCTIVSGRTIYDLLELFRNLDTEKVNWSGVHGAQIKYTGCDIDITTKIKKTLPKIIEIKEKISKIINNIPCYSIEDKGLSFALHYRKCRDKNLYHLRKINSILSGFEKDKSIEIMQMKKVVEIKPKGVDKGDAIYLVKQKYKKSIPSINICLGDDVTDEYLFKSNKDGINIKVIENKYLDSEAEYYLKDIEEVHWFLEMLYDILK